MLSWRQSISFVYLIFRFFCYSPVFIGFTSIAILLLSFGARIELAPSIKSLDLVNRYSTFNNITFEFSWLSKHDGSNSLAWGDVDADGDLDLAVGSSNGKERVYINVNGKLQSIAAWVSEEIDNTKSIAWGDVDNDGDLDLAVGNYNSPNKIYFNQNGTLQPSASWISADISSTQSIAWGDVDGDGDFDLAAGNDRQPAKLYLNQGKTLEVRPSWLSGDISSTKSIAWGDVDNDGDLDLAVGNSNDPNKLYLNEKGVLKENSSWTSADSDDTQSVVWGDIDHDGDLDLIAGNRYGATKIYYNQNGELQSLSTQILNDGGSDRVALGDIDGDGDLDIVAVQFNAPLRVYVNEGGQFGNTTIDAEIMGHELALGDVDGNGTLDLALSDLGDPDKIYLNTTKLFQPQESWTDLEYIDTDSVAWGDIDGDSDLDLASGNDEDPSKIYLNSGLMLEITPTWTAGDIADTWSVGWGDVDGDGDLDLAAASYGLRVYLNDRGLIEKTPSWITGGHDPVATIAWGDVDSDGDLDLAAGGYWETASRLYLNQNGRLQITPAWSSIDNGLASSLAWGDVDGDSDLDLAIGYSDKPHKLYLNDKGMLQDTPVWTTDDIDGFASSLAWGDVDGDNDLDLAIGDNVQPNKLYLNDQGMLQSAPAWTSSESGRTSSVLWIDIDNDGDLDLAATGVSTKIYLNEGKTLRSAPVTLTTLGWANSMAAGDVDGDGDFDLLLASDGYRKLYSNLRPAHPVYTWPNNRPAAIAISLSSNPVSTFTGLLSSALAPANFYATAAIRQSGIIPIEYTLFQPGNEPVRAIRVYYSLEGSFSGDRSQWRVAKPAPGTQMTELAATVYPTKTATNTHVFTWDVFGSGFIGQSDNVVIRIEALPNLKPIRNGVPGPFQRPYVATQTFPFRVRGNQVRIINATQANTPAEQAVVYRLPADQTQIALPFTANSSKLLRTDQQGYLQGRGRLEAGDRLFALAPITVTDKYTVYHTNGVVTPTGLEGYTVQAGGIQTITVSSANTLILYNLVVSLEWDARNDPTFMAQLENDLRRTSQILFDLTNGQAALGDVRIYHDKGFWGTADVVIAASNNQRPNAILGGSVLTPTADVDINGNAIPDAYVPGQVRMGATWNRFGNPNGTLGEDWPRTLAHELGHYLFFVPDNYIGVTPDRQFVQIVDCQGSVMTDPYEESYSEFLTADQWQTAACQRSVAAVYLGRPDWATITRFYPMLNGQGGNPGPAQLPLAVTRIATFAPPRPATTLAAPFFPLVNQQGQTISVPDGRGQVYLFKTGSNADPTDDYIIALGTPIGDLVQARGAAPGDRLCVFDYAHQPLRLGCQVVIGNAPSPITLAEVADWSPQIQVRGLTTNTVIVTVTHVSADNLAVQLLPALGVASPELPMTRQGSAFVQTVTAADGAYFGFIRIWVPGSNPLQELIVEYSANESWDGRARAWGTTADAWGGRARAWGGRAYGWGGRARAWGAPVMSSDGQVSIFPLDNPFAGGAQYTLQSVAFPPALPAWLTAVGQAYRVASNGALARSAILFNYLGRDVPDGYENFLTIYYSPDEGRSWQRLPTDLDTNRNQASAPVLGEGIYLLVATVPSNPALGSGWNTIGYPIQTTQPITQALASVAGKYSVVYHYWAAPTPAWQTFAPDVPAPFDTLVNDLRRLELGHAYWLYATEATNLYWGVGNGVTASQAAASTNAPTAPAIYYGWIPSSATFSPIEGMRVTATIDGVVCGETTVHLFNGQPGYVLRVAANDPQDAATTCGEVGKVVTFTVGDRTMAQTSPWSNQAAQFFSMGPTGGLSAPLPQPHTLYLPLVRK